MTRSTYRHGHFVWHELMTTNGDAAEKFYGALLGWTFRHTAMGENHIYRLIDANGREIGGIIEMPQKDFHSHWCGYVSVPDVDAAAKTAAEQGGTVTCAPMDIPDVGRVAYVLDPEGGSFAVFRDNKGDAAPPEMPGAGEFCWDSLATKDADRALAFYGAVVNWKRGSFGDAPGMFFAANSGETIADVEPPQGNAPSHWVAHVVVPNLIDARAKAESLGAKILVNEINVPNVGVMAYIRDPLGSVISLFEPRMPN